MSFINKYKDLVIVFIATVFYFFFAYFIERTSFELLSITWFILFGCYIYILKKTKLSFNHLIGISILFRLIFLFATPNLSQDFYRFIWDGRMIFEGLNPYLSIPKDFIEQGLQPINQSKLLFDGMGNLSASNYTNYPPINQLCFLIAAIISGKSIFGAIIVFRLMMITADLGILYFGKKLLEKLQLPIKNIYWYVLNPFVIIEMTGNLHFEPVMLFFLVFALYQLHQKKWIWAAILMAFAVSVKLIPLLFLPLFFQWFVSKDLPKSLKSDFKIIKKNVLKLVSFYAIIVGINIVLFLPFYSDDLILNYSKSVGLWFKNFEFNASFYYIFREIGYLFRAYNEIAIIGKFTSFATVLFLLIIAVFRKNIPFKNLITAMLLGISFYYFFASTVHPWYLATPLVLCVFTKYTFPILWTFMVILSYQAYANIPWKENLWLLALEYLLVYSFFIYELKKASLKKMIN